MVGAEFICSECNGTDMVHSKDDLLEKLKCKNCRKLVDITMDDVLKLIEEAKE